MRVFFLQFFIVFFFNLRLRASKLSSELAKYPRIACERISFFAWRIPRPWAMKLIRSLVLMESNEIAFRDIFYPPEVSTRGLRRILTIEVTEDRGADGIIDIR